MLTFPNAKINLGLNITEKRPDGYHNLETIFYPIPVEDALEINPLREGDGKYCLHQAGMEIAGEAENNLVVKAYKQLDGLFDLPPVDIHLFKHIPSGAGLGGGSADAAFMLKMLNEKFGLGLSTGTLEEYAARLGADCAFFIRNAVSLSLKGYQLWLVNPDIFVSTRDAFSQIKPHRPERSLKEPMQLPVEAWKEYMVNDFEESVFPQFPAIGAIKDEMYRQGAVYASMSGSGSSVYGLFAADAVLPDVDFGEKAFVYKGKLTV